MFVSYGMSMTNTLLTDKNVAIVGGGPGGLTLARLLQMNGADVKVYERDQNRNVRVQGATLDLHYDSGLKALEAAGLTNAFMAKYRPGADKMVITDRLGNVMHRDEFAGEGEGFRPEIDRGPLRDILLDSLQPDTVVWDSQFTSIVERNSVFKLSFSNETEAYADIVIAADGANSKLRPFITDTKPFYCGMVALEGAVYDFDRNAPELAELLNGGKIFAMGDAKSLIVSSKGDGSAAFYLGFKTDENWTSECGIDFGNNAQVAEWFSKEFAGWGDIWKPLFEQASAPFIPRPQYCMPIGQQWKSHPNITMLGDAAHLMPPYAGEGVNMAMLDALELAENLLDESHKSVAEAIASYEQKMLERTSEVAQVTLDQTDIIHSENGLQYLTDMFKQPASGGLE